MTSYLQVSLPSISKAGQRQGFLNPTTGTLFFEILRILKYHHPPYVLLENVRNLTSHDKGNTWRVIHDSLQQAGYNLQDNPTIFSPHYLGIPQHRERVLIMCVRKDIGKVPEVTFDTSKLPPCQIDDILLSDDEIPHIDRYRLNKDERLLLSLWNEFLQGVNKNALPTFPVWSEYLCTKEKYSEAEICSYPSWKRNIIEKNFLLWQENESFLAKWKKPCKGMSFIFWG